MNSYDVITNPNMLPKIRSDDLKQSIKEFPDCTLKIASFVGKRCEDGTGVGCHLGNLGKGKNTKVSDINMAGGCSVCHAILDGVDQKTLDAIRKQYPHAFGEQVLRAQHETQARWVQMGLLIVPGSRIIYS